MDDQPANQPVAVQPERAASSRWDVAVFALVLFASIALAGHAYHLYLQDPDSIWYGTVHDRHTHYLFGLQMGMDIRNLDVIDFVSELHRAQVWGIVHGLLLAIVQAVGGPDIRIAVLPSLLAWIGTAIFAFLAARRLTAKRGNAAGLIAATFVLVSPAHQAFATDVMLESLGACLTLACVYYYLVVVQDGTVASRRGFGLALTLLFLTKYNYWILIAVGLMFGEIVRNRAAVWALALGLKDRFLSKGVFLAQLKSPITYLFAAAFGHFAIGFIMDGGLPASRPSRLWPHPQITLYVAYALFLVKLTQWYLNGGREWLASQHPVVGTLYYWHLAPIMFWFLWPKRLAHCVWYLSRNHGGEVSTFVDGLGEYYDFLAQDYHLAAWSVVLVGVLVLLALTTVMSMRSGSIAVLCALLLIVAVNLKHHSKRSRFLHSWIALAWVAGGAGAVHGIVRIWPRRMDAWQPAAVSLGVAGFVFLHASGFTDDGHAAEGGPKRGLLHMLEVTRSIAPIANSEAEPVLVSNMPIRSMLGWTSLEFAPKHRRLQTVLRGLPFRGITQEKLDDWLKKSKNSALIHVDFKDGGPLHEDFPDHPYRELGTLLKKQQIYRKEQDWTFDHLGIQVSVWRNESMSTAKRRP